MKKMRINGQWKAKCNYCHKELASGPRAGTKHLASHLKICTLKMLKMKGGKTLSQPSLRMNAKEDGNVFLESYTFDQEVARRELGNMLVLHEY
uniref:BED-type domain-containing protein n=1 Tax=Triticum urartu TaxID=4572 RepID=A0A8R7P4S9_TRIUA